jgi:predicted DNA-binding transcriptional regulator AlpA
MKLLPEPGYTGIGAYCAIFDMSKPTYYRGVEAGTQPKAQKITEGRRAIANGDINKRILKLQEDADQKQEDARGAGA